MRRIPKFSLLHAFEAAARTESFSMASDELCITPSAVSHQIRELESYFGRKLFVRQNRRVELTPEGRRLQESLSQVFETIETACDEVRLAPQEQILALYCAASFAVKWLGPRLPEFVKACPDITIRLTSGAEQIDLTRTKELDVVISYNEPPVRKGVVSHALGQEKIVPLCAPTLLSPGSTARQQLPELVLIESQLNRVKWSNWFALNGLALPNRARPSFDRAAMSISAAADGMGVALESTRLAEREINRGDLVVVGADEFEPILQETHFLSYRAIEQNLEKVRAFREWLLSQTDIALLSH